MYFFFVNFALQLLLYHYTDTEKKIFMFFVVAWSLSEYVATIPVDIGGDSWGSRAIWFATQHHEPNDDGMGMGSGNCTTFISMSDEEGMVGTQCASLTTPTPQDAIGMPYQLATVCTQNGSHSALERNRLPPSLSVVSLSLSRSVKVFVPVTEHYEISH